jgi:dihydrofolate synthase/folylpolyglutamate synthase
MPESTQVSYDNAVARIFALGHELANSPSRKFDLVHMRVLLEALGNPQRRFPPVLIAGTNGKGSTAAVLASILQVSRVRTGLYTSPHLVRINERIRIDGHEIADQEFASIYEVVEAVAGRLVSEGALPWHPSFFEMLTAIAFEYFARQKVEVAVLEVGMGGRLDATNVVEPLVSVITDISLDHQDYLGHTIAEIAGEKAGIIGPHGIVVTLPQQPQANDVIGNAILNLGARGISAVPYVPPVSPGSDRHLDPSQSLSRYPLEIMGREIQVETSLLGRHQLRNIALAIATAEELSHHNFPIDAVSIEQGIRQARWPGRFQVLPAADGRPEYVFDVAHNPAGAWALRSTLSAAYEDRRLIFVFGAMRDKAIAEIAEILFPLTDRVITVQANNPRAATSSEILEAAIRTSAEIEPAEGLPAALDRARTLASPDGIVVVTGSIYVVGEAMRILGACI